MPNISITIYLSEKDYIEYIQQKEDIHESVRELVKKEIAKAKRPK